MSLINTMFFSTVFCLLTCAGFIIALILTVNVTFRKQSVKTVSIIWVPIGLWGRYFVLFTYYTSGIRKDSVVEVAPVESMKMDVRMPMEMDIPDMRPRWQPITLSVFHYGMGYALVDLIEEWFIYQAPLRIGGGLTAGSWALDFVLALVIGVFFQFAAIHEMEKISFSKAVSRTFRVDFFSLLAWQIGMYGWTAVVTFVLFIDVPLEKISQTSRFMIQIAMLSGLILSYPVNALLVKTGIKKGM